VKILHMITGLGGGGAERQLSYLAPALSRRGHDVHVAFAFAGVHSERLAGSPCTLHHLSASSRFALIRLAQTIPLVRRLRPDVLHTWLTHMDIVGYSAVRLLRVPWLMSERSAALSYPPTLLNRLRVAAGKRADVIVSNSEGGAEYWRTQSVEADRIEIVPNFVPLADIEAAGPLHDERVSADDELVIHIGRLSPEKNLSALVSALPHVFRARPRAKFAFCGEGLLLGDLTAQVAAAGLRERVVFAGFVPNVASWLKRASAAVAVSRCEGHPNAVLEAMAAGVPVVVSDIPAYRSILGDESAAFAGGDNIEGIADAIINTLEDRAAAELRAARARLSLASQSIDATAARYEHAYRRAIEIAVARH